MAAPVGLKTEGKRLWKAIAVDGLELRPDEQATLRAAAETADEIERLSKEAAAGEILVRGSQGQKVIRPSIQECRQQRALLASLLARLDLPEPGEDGDNPWDNLTASQRARKAARARYDKGRR
jgi:hypothetical protein